MLIINALLFRFFFFSEGTGSFTSQLNSTLISFGFCSFSISQKVLVLLQKCDFIIYQPNKIQYIYGFKRNKIQPKARY